MTKVNTADWRNLAIDKWNVRSFHAYFADMNREYYGVDYAPMRNWKFEQGVIKRALAEHGAPLLKRCFDVIFREYRPTREFPVLTAGFTIAYRLNAVLPRIKQQRIVDIDSDNDVATADDVRAWL